MVRPLLGPLLCLLAACGTPAPAPPFEPAEPVHLAPVALPAHLVDLATDAHLALPPPPTPAPHVFLREDFEGPLDLGAWEERDPKAGTSVSQGSLGTLPTGGIDDSGQFCIQSAGAGPSAVPTLRREVSTEDLGGDLRVTVSVRTEDLAPVSPRAPGAGIRVAELDTKGEVLVLHDELPRLWATQDWREISTTLTLDPDTRRLRLDLEATDGRTAGTACFDALKVEALHPYEATRSGAPVSPGIREADHPLVRAVMIKRETRPALLAPGPTTWALTVPREQEAVVELGWARLPASPGRICLTVREAIEDLVLFEGCRSDGASRTWEDLRLPLPARPGTTAELHLEARPEGQAVIALADPTVRALGRAPGDTRPDVLLVVIDTLRADHLGAEGYTTRQTSPILDAFAATATRFSQAQAPAPWTAPSLGSVVTGLLPSGHRAGQRRVRAWLPRDSKQTRGRAVTDYLTLSPTVPTLAERLRVAGYQTLGVVTNNFFGPRVRFDRGFSRYTMGHGTSPAAASRVAEEVRAIWSTEGPPGDREPLFLVVHIIEPHHPYRMREPVTEGWTVPDAFPLELEEKHGVVAHTLRRISTEAKAHPEAMKVLYDAEIRYADAALGPLLSEVDPAHTAVLLLSDHGEAFGEHGRFIHGDNLYEELLDVPLWLRLPDQAAGSVVDTPVSLTDVVPTVLQLAGQPLPADLDGRPLSQATTDPRTLISEAMYAGPERIAVRAGSLKYILTLPTPQASTRLALPRSSRTAGERLARGELYDLSADPHERHELSEAQPEEAARLRALALEHLSRSTPGLHLRCERVPKASVDMDAIVGTVDKVDLVAGDQVVILRSRDGVRLGFAGDGVHHVVVHPLKPPEQLTVSAGERWSGGPGALLSPIDVGACRVWWVAGPGDGVSELAGTDAEELRALGYLE